MAAAEERPGSVGLEHLEELRSELRAEMAELAAKLEAMEKQLRFGASEGKPGPAGSTMGSNDAMGSNDEEATFVDTFAAHGSVWDAALVANARGTPCDHAFYLVTLVLTLAMQVVFCYIINNSGMTAPPLDEGTLKELAVWRMAFGHSIEHYDALTNSSLVSRVCGNAAFGIKATTQQSLFEDLANYDTLTHVLFLLTVFLWIYEIVWDLFNSYDFLRAVLSVPRGVTSRLESDGTRLSYVSMSPKHALGLVLGVILPKVLIACWLGALGVQFLSNSLRPKDLIMDAISLKFVLHLDEALYHWLAPGRIRRSVARLRPIPITRFKGSVRLSKRLPIREILPFLCVLMAIAVLAPTFLVPQINLAVRASGILCSGNQDFVYAGDRATGVIAVTDTATFALGSKGLLFESYAFRAVQQRADVDMVSLLEEGAVGPSGAPEHSNIYVHSTLEVLMSLSIQDIDHAIDNHPCRDSVEAFDGGPNASMQQALLAKFEGAEYCSNLTQGDCSTREGRTFCPETCLCDDSETGSLNRWGCPTRCSTILEGNFLWWLNLLKTYGECSDSDDKAEEFAGYFAEVQTLLIDRGSLQLERNSSYYPSLTRFVEFGYEVDFEIGIDPFANFTLSEWARETYVHGNSTGDGTRCKLISFVYRMFRFDACEADRDEAMHFGGRAGSLRYLCPETCGYCDTPGAADYRSANYSDLAGWLLGAGINLLQPLNDSEVCAWYLEDERWGGWADYWHGYLHDWCYGNETA